MIAALNSQGQFAALHKVIDAAPRRLTLQEADRVAERVIGELSAFCTRISVAGSVRRRCVNVADVDIVAEPKPMCVELLKARLFRHSREICSGEFCSAVLNNGVQIDLWFTRPEERTLLGVIPANWGSVLLCRTGSIRHNLWLLRAAEQAGLKWKPHEGVVDSAGRVIASATEEEIFSAIGQEFLKPERRER